MDRLLCWNVWGINNIRKQADVRNYIHSLSLGIVCLLETKVKAANLGSLYQRVFLGGASLQTPAVMIEEG